MTRRYPLFRTEARASAIERDIAQQKNAEFLAGQAKTMPVPQDRATQDQLAAVLLQHGTPAQQEAAVRYASQPSDAPQQGDAAMFMRDACESEVADPEHPDTICINRDHLAWLVQQHFATQQPQPAQTSGDAADAARWRHLAALFDGANSSRCRNVVEALGLWDADETEPLSVIIDADRLKGEPHGSAGDGQQRVSNAYGSNPDDDIFAGDDMMGSSS